MLSKCCQSKRPVSVTAPPSALPCPQIDFVSEFITSPAPTLAGWNKCGVVMVLSTTYSTPRCAHSLPMASRSAICVRGLAIVSTNTSRVCGSSARSTSAASVASTRLTRPPSDASVCSRLAVLPNRNWLATMWSPCFSKASSTEAMAAMPVEKHTVPTPPSSRLTFCSSAWLVGLPWRAYTWPPFSPWNTAASSAAVA